MKKKLTPTNFDVMFIGWQETLSGTSIALYTIKKKYHPACVSTVSEKTLKDLHLNLPKHHYTEDNEHNSSG